MKAANIRSERHFPVDTSRPGAGCMAGDIRATRAPEGHVRPSVFSAGQNPGTDADLLSSAANDSEAVVLSEEDGRMRATFASLQECCAPEKVCLRSGEELCAELSDAHRSRVVFYDLTSNSDEMLNAAFHLKLHSARHCLLCIADSASDRWRAAVMDLMVRFRARALLSADTAPAELVSYLPAMKSGGVFVDQEFRRHVAPSADGTALEYRGSSPLRGLTLRQIQILIQLASGHSVPTVARKLFIARKTVESHKYRIMLHLGLDTNVELCRFAIRHGLIVA